MGYWIINGKEYSEEEHKEYQEQEQKRWELDEAEVQRLISAVGEAYTACEKFMEDHPQYPYGMKDDAQQREFKIYQNLRSSVGAANQAPRCEKVREDGTRCGSPRMKGYGYCYAHERMLQTQSQNLQLPALEDANGIQMAIMRVQKALIDDEITEKKAGLLLYSLQMASSNLKHTTFASSGEKGMAEMKDPPRGGTSRVKQANGKWQLAKGESEDQTQHLTTESQRHGENLSPQMNADRRRLDQSAPEGTRAKKGKCMDPSAAVGMTNQNSTLGKSKDRPEPGAAVPHEHRLG